MVLVGTMKLEKPMIKSKFVFWQWLTMYIIEGFRKEAFPHVDEDFIIQKPIENELLLENNTVNYKSSLVILIVVIFHFHYHYGHYKHSR